MHITSCKLQYMYMLPYVQYIYCDRTSAIYCKGILIFQNLLGLDPDPHTSKGIRIPSVSCQILLVMHHVLSCRPGEVSGRDWSRRFRAVLHQLPGWSGVALLHRVFGRLHGTAAHPVPGLPQHALDRRGLQGEMPRPALALRKLFSVPITVV